MVLWRALFGIGICAGLSVLLLSAARAPHARRLAHSSSPKFPSSVSYTDNPPPTPKGQKRWYYVTLFLKVRVSRQQVEAIQGVVGLDSDVRSIRFVSCRVEGNLVDKYTGGKPNNGGCNSGGNIGLTPELCVTASAGPRDEAATWALAKRYNLTKLPGLLQGTEMIISTFPTPLCQPGFNGVSPPGP